MQRQMYIGVEVVSLTAPQRQTLIDALKTLGANTDPSPARRNHWRIRLDNDACIFQAEFDDTSFTVNALRQRLATIFGVALALVTSATTNPATGTVFTVSYQSVARVRFVLFGGASASYQESGDAARAYLLANSVAWESQI